MTRQRYELKANKQNNNFAAGFQSLQISRSDLVVEAQLVAALNERDWTLTDPIITQRVKSAVMKACLRHHHLAS